MDKLTLALLFFYRGVKIAPCQPKSKAFCAGYGPYLRHIESDIELDSWLTARDGNYALLTGTGGLVVIDFDNPSIFEAWRQDAGSLADTFTVRTADGYHVYFTCDDLRSWRGEGFEVMGLHRAVMGPGSTHPEGAIYTPQGQPIIRKLESICDFPLLSAPPKLPAPPAIRPDELGGGIIQKIKRHYRLLDVIAARPELAARIRLKTSDRGGGRWYAGFCPFHNDRRKPSFWLDAERDLYGCRACDARGDVINFLARLEGQENREMIRTLAGGIA